MSDRQTAAGRAARGWAACLLLSLITAAAAAAQPAAPQAPAAPDSQKRITPEQAQKLFSAVDELMKFSSGETGLPIRSEVKRKLTTRAEVVAYLQKKFDEDQSAKRLQRDEIVLKKFGLLDRDFDLKPFLLSLLKEQIEAYYDSKTRTVNLLDWVQPDEQKPVLAHELTHALQDQRVNLDKWDDQTPDDVSVNAAGDTEHLARDEMDTARDAVAEGQATAAMMDYILKPMGKSLIKDPEVMDLIRSRMTDNANSPVMARAPLLLSESMLFPYRDGLGFEQDVWMDQGQHAAFAGALDNPPSSSWEILNPRVYEQRRTPPIPLLPDMHPLVDKLYKPYDIGQVGALDVHILTQLFGGDGAARDLTSAWDGGIYWAGQSRSATAAQKATTASLAIFYLSIWKNPESAQQFARLYAGSLGSKYASIHQDTAAADSANAASSAVEQVWTTNEGPVVITTQGNMVFVSESFPLNLARKLAQLVMGAQGAGAMRMTRMTAPAQPGSLANPSAMAEADAHSARPLSADLVHFFSNCGVLKAVVDAAAASTR